MSMVARDPSVACGGTASCDPDASRASSSDLIALVGSRSGSLVRTAGHLPRFGSSGSVRRRPA